MKNIFYWGAEKIIEFAKVKLAKEHPEWFTENLEIQSMLNDNSGGYAIVITDASICFGIEHQELLKYYNKGDI